MIDAVEPYTIEDRLIESLHTFESQTNEAVNSVIAKYAPKDRTYSSTMSLSNRISIVIGIHNDGYQAFWSEAFLSLQLDLFDSLGNHLRKKDRTKQLKKEYVKRSDVKLRRVKNHIDKMREMMEKQRLDEIRGFTYQSGSAIAGLVPSRVEKMENEKKKRGKIDCKLPGCYVKGHRSVRSKKCKYHHCTGRENLHDAVRKEMKLIYPEEYGKFDSIVLRFCLVNIYYCFFEFVVFFYFCNMFER